MVWDKRPVACLCRGVVIYIYTQLLASLYVAYTLGSGRGGGGCYTCKCRRVDKEPQRRRWREASDSGDNGDIVRA